MSVLPVHFYVFFYFLFIFFFVSSSSYRFYGNCPSYVSPNIHIYSLSCYHCFFSISAFAFSLYIFNFLLLSSCNVFPLPSFPLLLYSFHLLPLPPPPLLPAALITASLCRRPPPLPSLPISCPLTYPNKASKGAAAVGLREGWS